jgi:hypothetical protein
VTERSVTHDTFVVERSYPASPARVFAAWADPAAKARWFASPPTVASPTRSQLNDIDVLLFRSADRRLRLELLQTRSFRSGNVLLTYRPA